MASVQPLDWRVILTRGAVAGLIGAVLIDAFLYVATLMPQHTAITGMWQFIASTVIGKAAFANPNTAWLGLFMHLIISIAWGVAFAYVAQTRPNVPAHPYVSGIVYGIIVMILMQIVTLAANVPAALTVPALTAALIAHTLFFGLPVSLYVARAMRV
ncbi:MAG: hypothetical protein M3126_08115 [Candidatus Eremiobacteraeota bacterium]|nr:hypothetical protein [Candidatus Eremiobacteraeota bacterium]